MLYLRRVCSFSVYLQQLQNRLNRLLLGPVVAQGSSAATKTKHSQRYDWSSTWYARHGHELRPNATSQRQPVSQTNRDNCDHTPIVAAHDRGRRTLAASVLGAAIAGSCVAPGTFATGRSMTRIPSREGFVRHADGAVGVAAAANALENGAADVQERHGRVAGDGARDCSTPGSSAGAGAGAGSAVVHSRSRLSPRGVSTQWLVVFALG